MALAKQTDGGGLGRDVAGRIQFAFAWRSDGCLSS